MINYYGSWKEALAMHQDAHLRFRKGDLLAIGFVIILAVTVLLCFFPKSSAASAQAAIYLNGQLIRTVDLTEDQTFVITDRYTNVITVENGRIFIQESDCPGQDCVHSGSIHAQGRILVCLPNGLEIRITSAEEDVDFVVG